MVSLFTCQFIVLDKSQTEFAMKYFEASPGLTRWDCIRMTFSVIIFSIMLPLADIIFDIKTIVRLIWAGHPIFASLFLGFYYKPKKSNKLTIKTLFIGPFLANYFFSFLNWYRFETSNSTLIWALLNLYPVYGKYVSSTLDHEHEYWITCKVNLF